ncbi:hypothetical protein CSOJ01_09150 [Colletotrichum sojae]|uniref:Zn(2)-C6 fungal-type domain-containing protein n=1 Tax=Colletotrichum sojae TaxID=2175907 RepID=A0A8H6J3Z8_9PEZI|nr:hypothetical protein CSOJ01_09150 [Colletotrichum sojae]
MTRVEALMGKGTAQDKICINSSAINFVNILRNTFSLPSLRITLLSLRRITLASEDLIYYSLRHYDPVPRELFYSVNPQLLLADPTVLETVISRSLLPGWGSSIVLPGFTHDADTMSGRVQKSKSSGSSTRRRLLRILRFANEGIEIYMPCSNCRSRGLRCLLLPDCDICGTCHRLGIPCNASEDAICTRTLVSSVLFLVKADSVVNRLVAESDRLNKEEEVEEAKFRERAALLQQKAEAYRKAQSELNESLAKLERLREQKRMVFKKGRVVSAESSEEAGAASVPPATLEAQLVGAWGGANVDALFDWNPVTPNFFSEKTS